MGTGLRVAFWNAQSLRRKKKLLAIFLQEQRIDVMLVSETHLSSAETLKLPNYITYRKDEKNSVGVAYRGLAVLVHRKVIHQLIPVIEFQTLQALGVLVNVAGENLQIYAVYKPPLERVDVRELRSLLNTDTPTIVAGDMNAKHHHWNSNRVCRNGRLIHQDSVDHQYEVIGPSAWTHYTPTGSGDVIDIALYKGLTATPHLTALPDLPSDHRPVLLVLEETPSRVAAPSRRRKICWDSFHREAQQRTTTRPITTEEELERATEELTTAIQDSLAAASHTSSPARRLDPLPARIRDLIREKREKRKLWQQTRCPQVKREVNALVVRVRLALDEHAAKRWEEHIADITDEIPSIHRLCKQLATTAPPVQPLIGSDGLLRFEAEDRAEIFAEHLERQFTPNPTSDTTHVEAVHEAVREYFSTPTSPSTTTSETAQDQIYWSPGRVAGAIKRLPRKKAPGPDGITNEALKNLPKKTVAAMARVFNGILRTGHFPSNWKIGKVVMLQKPGKDARKPESYRPITLLNTMSKVFERLLLQVLTPHIEPREEQFGFRAEHSTTLQISKLVNEMAMCHNKKEYVVAVLLDMEKAFDRVWHEGLLFKLMGSTTPIQILQIVKSFLENRSITVSVEGKISSQRPVKAGVPQGSCLSPACYAWYTNDIPVIGQAKLALYADDAAYYTSSYKPAFTAQKLKPTLDALPEWLEKWRMAINVDKTQAIITGYCNLPPPLEFKHTVIPWRTDVKYLGVTIDRRLTFKKHVDTIIGSVKRARAKLIPILTSKLPLKTKTMLYKTYIRSRLTYAAPAWWVQLSLRNKERLQTLQNATLRRIAGAPRYVRNHTIARDLKMDSMETFVRHLSQKMHERADKSRHEHLKNLAPLHARPPELPGRKTSKPTTRDLIMSTDTTEDPGPLPTVPTAGVADRSAGPSMGQP